MSVVRIKAYHSEKEVHNGKNYSEDREKTNFNYRTGNESDPYSGQDKSVGMNVRNAFTYAVNPDKTHVNFDGGEDILVSGVGCKPDLAEYDFKLSRDLYYAHGHKEKLSVSKSKRLMRAKLDENGQPVRDINGELIYDETAPVYKDENGKAVYQEYEYQKQARMAYMWVMSFAGKKELGYEVNPRLVHEIGRRFCEEYLGDYACTVSTHVNTEHYHNHIMQCAYSMDGTHKYRDDMENLKKARDICDHLSQEFGLPIIINPSSDKGMQWFEWKKRLDGESWKEQLRQDIRATLSISADFNEYKSLMEEAGYKLRETEKHITYYLPNAEEEGVEYRCRDTRLNINDDAMDYSKENIMAMLEGRDIEQEKKNQERESEKARKMIASGKKNFYLGRIYIQRYTLEGRRRSDIEILIIEALKIITLLKDAFTPPNPVQSSPVYYPSTQKLEMMYEALNTASQYGIKDKTELEQEVNRAGITLSQLKKQFKGQDAVYKEERDTLSKIDEVLELLEYTKSIGFDEKDFRLYDYKDTEIRKNKAELTPITPAQKRELYIAISESPVLRLSVKYDDLTYMEAQQAIDFLKGKSSIRPSVLTDLSEQDERRLKNKYEKVLESRIAGLKNKYQDQPATESQIKKVRDLVSQGSEKMGRFESFEIDPEKMSYYDAYRFINFFTSENIYTGDMASDKSMTKIQELISKNGDKLNRDVITQKEADELITWYQNRKGHIPDLIKKDYKPGTAKQVAAVKELLQLRGESVSIPLENLSDGELFRLNTYLLLKEDIPETLTLSIKEERNIKDMYFMSSISDYSLKEQESIDRARTLLNELSAVGIAPDRLLEAHAELEAAIQGRDDTKKEMDRASEEYKKLKKLQYQVGLAGNKKFTCGALFDDVLDIERVERLENVKKEDQERQKREEDEIRKDQDKNKGKTTKDKFFDTISQ